LTATATCGRGKQSETALAGTGKTDAAAWRSPSDREDVVALGGFATTSVAELRRRRPAHGGADGKAAGRLRRSRAAARRHTDEGEAKALQTALSAGAASVLYPGER
jgi:hypothetical protein